MSHFPKPLVTLHEPPQVQTPISSTWSLSTLSSTVGSSLRTGFSAVCQAALHTVQSVSRVISTVKPLDAAAIVVSTGAIFIGISPQHVMEALTLYNGLNALMRVHVSGKPVQKHLETALSRYTPKQQQMIESVYNRISNNPDAFRCNIPVKVPGLGLVGCVSAAFLMLLQGVMADDSANATLFGDTDVFQPYGNFNHVNGTLGLQGALRFGLVPEPSNTALAHRPQEVLSTACVVVQLVFNNPLVWFAVARALNPQPQPLQPPASFDQWTLIRASGVSQNNGPFGFDSNSEVGLALNSRLCVEYDAQGVIVSSELDGVLQETRFDRSAIASDSLLFLGGNDIVLAPNLVVNGLDLIHVASHIISTTETPIPVTTEDIVNATMSFSTDAPESTEDPTDTMSGSGVDDDSGGDVPGENDPPTLSPSPPPPPADSGNTGWKWLVNTTEGIITLVCGSVAVVAIPLTVFVSIARFRRLPVAPLVGPRRGDVELRERLRMQEAGVQVNLSPLPGSIAFVHDSGQV